MRTTPTGRKSRSHAEWQELVEKQEQSGLSIGAFCKRKGVARTSFDKWKNRLSEVQKKKVSNRAKFVELDAPPRTVIKVELEFPNGSILRIN